MCVLRSWPVVWPPGRLPAALLLAGLLGACSVLKEPPRPAVYDFGPPAAQPVQRDGDDARLPAVALAQVGATQTLDSTALLYRLVYANDQQLRPYALARWSATPAELVRQRLRERLSRQRPVLAPLEPGAPLTLKVELDEFSQVFESATQSFGVVRLTATLIRNGDEQPLGQRNVVMRRPATTPDAPGGVKALTDAVDAAADDVAQWLLQLR